jgi:hypothetical protein
MTPLLEFLVTDRLATLRREADRERLIRAAMTGSRRRRRGLFAWFRTHRPQAVPLPHLAFRPSARTSSGSSSAVTCEENPR